MARSNVFTSDTYLFNTATGEKRLFPKGESDPGNAWSEKEGGEAPGSATTTQALKDLIAAQDQIERLQATLSTQDASMAVLAGERDAAAGKVEGLEQAAADAEKARAEAETAAHAYMTERDAARAEAARMSDLLKGLEAAKAEAIANAELYAEDNGKLSARIVELEADVAKVDGDKDGKVGGTKPKADKTAEAA